MKQTLISIFIAGALLALGVFAWKFWKSSNYWKGLYDQQVGEYSNLEQEYNRAKVVITDKIREIEVLDERLKGEVSVRTVKEVIYITITGETSGGGELTPVTESSHKYHYEDYHLSVDVDTSVPDLRYSLSQEFKMNLFVSKGEDYRAELIEMDGNNPVTSYTINEFVVIKEADDADTWHFGFNLIGGFGGVYGSELDWDAHALVNFISYGQTHLDSTWRLLSLGAGKAGAIVAPVSYSIGKHMMLFSDLHVYPYAGVSFDGKFFGGLGIGTTF